MCPVPPQAIGTCHYIAPNTDNFTPNTDRVQFPLTSAQPSTASRVRGKARLVGQRAFCWLGELDDGGSVALAVSEQGALAGEVRTAGGRRFRVRFEIGAGYFLEELNPQAFLVPPMHSTEEKIVSSDPRACKSDPPNRMDVFFVYTKKVRDELGPQAQVEAVAQLAVCETNWSYEDGGVLFEIKSVGVKLLDYGDDAEHPMEQRSRIMEARDGLQDVSTWRNELGADFGVLLVERPGLGGNAPQFSSANVDKPESFAAYAYAVIDRFSFTGPGGYMLAHELGHMMGANHDKANSDGNGAFPAFSNAHIQPPLRPSPSPTYPNGWRTIMAEGSDGCLSCERVRTWSTSDANKKWDGQAVGSASEDNVQTLNRTARTTANFRCAGSP